ncbi:hypothetical protein K440DRAFT_63485 [Wilcoxina mikolae CBS 423.85]|nr:hypothetical protein K440DRAFT_63485 [Wilcoxina mikolae CBS 423.85]
MDFRLSTYTTTSLHPNKQYPTPPVPASSYHPSTPPETHDAPPSYTRSAPPAHGLGLVIPEKHFTTVTLHDQTPISATTSLPNQGLIKPLSPSSQKREFLSLTISRSRFILRVISTIFSMVIVGMMSSAYSAFYTTVGHKLMYGGWPIWPDTPIDLTASNAIFAVGAATATFSIVVLLAGIWPSVRHVTRLGDMVAGGVGGVNFVLGLGGAVFATVYQGQEEGLMGWTCGHELVRHPQAEFGTMCAGMRFSVAMGWGIAVVEGLVLGNVLVGWVVVRRGKAVEGLGRSIRGSFRSRV